MVGDRTSVTGAWFTGGNILVVVGGAMMIAASLLNWAGPVRGTHTHIRSLWDPEFTTSGLIRSVGFAMILLGAVAIVGLLAKTKWVSLIAGLVGIAVAVLFLVEVQRGSAGLEQVGAGVWLSLAGAACVLIGSVNRRSAPGE